MPRRLTLSRMQDVLEAVFRDQPVVLAGGLLAEAGGRVTRVRALGASRVFCLILPERDSDVDSAARAELLASHLGVRAETFDIAPTLEAIGCYAARDAAVRVVLPDYDSRWKMKLVISGGSAGGINRFRVVARSPDGM